MFLMLSPGLVTVFAQQLTVRGTVLDDIENITVLKDASMYGVRGANGAIVIHTRRR